MTYDTLSTSEGASEDPAEGHGSPQQNDSFEEAESWSHVRPARYLDPRSLWISTGRGKNWAKWVLRKRSKVFQGFVETSHSLLVKTCRLQRPFTEVGAAYAEQWVKFRRESANLCLVFCKEVAYF